MQLSVLVFVLLCYLASTSAADTIGSALSDALKNPRDQTAVTRFIESLPYLKSHDAYIVERCLLLKKEDIPQYIDDLRAPKPAVPSGELIVNYVLGRPDVWPRGQ